MWSSRLQLWVPVMEVIFKVPAKHSKGYFFKPKQPLKSCTKCLFPCGLQVSAVRKEKVHPQPSVQICKKKHRCGETGVPCACKSLQDRLLSGCATKSCGGYHTKGAAAAQPLGSLSLVDDAV